jgi:hypothetical protein
MDFKIGVICGITNEKPKFLEKCSSKVFEETMRQKIIELDSNLKLIENMKPATMLHLYTFLGFSVTALISTYFLTIWLWEKGWMSTISITVGAIGLGLIPLAVAPLNKYKRRISIAKENKDKLNTVLKLYNIEYEIITNLIKGPHDSIDIETDLTLIMNNKKENFHSKKINVSTTLDY